MVSNVAPRVTADIYERFAAGDLAGARALHIRLLPLIRALFLEANPIPVKAALAMAGHISWEIRTPLSVMDEDLQPELRAALNDLGLLEGGS